MCALLFCNITIPLFRRAFVYVGLYGYPYMTAGKKVMDLFNYRGWNTIISFDLVSGALGMASLVVGMLTGLIGLIVQSVNSSWFDAFGDASGYVAFL